MSMVEKDGSYENVDLTQEQQHGRAGLAFGEEYYNRIHNPGAESVYDLQFQIQPQFYPLFMSAAETQFQLLTIEDLKKQGLPADIAEMNALEITKAFGQFVRILYGNKLGIRKSPYPTKP